MTSEVRNALEVMVKECLGQESCSNCPIAEFCGQFPCEWDAIINND